MKTVMTERERGRAMGPRSRWKSAGLLLCLAIAPGCTSLNVFSLEDDRKLGEEAFVQISVDQKTVENGAQVDVVRKISERLIEAAREYHPKLVETFAWETRLFKADEVVNAFCLPGGKMGVFTGILPVAENEGGLAVVMGHEIAHATLRHGTQALTRAIGFELAITLVTGGADTELWNSALELMIGLPYGRKAELAADREGLLYMAAAGYDPRASTQFWERMAALSDGPPSPFLSTHPTNEQRIAQLEALMPEALEIFERKRAGQPASAP